MVNLQPLTASTNLIFQSHTQNVVATYTLGITQHTRLRNIKCCECRAASTRGKMHRLNDLLGYYSPPECDHHDED